MNPIKAAVLAFAVIALVASTGFAAGSMAEGKKLFNDTSLSTNNMSCNSCHPDGKGLEKAGLKGRKEWTNPGGTWLSLEDTNNVCIILALKGKTLDPKSKEMKDLTAYVRSLAKKKMM